MMNASIAEFPELPKQNHKPHIQSKLVNFYFNLTRKHDISDIRELANDLDLLIDEIKNYISKADEDLEFYKNNLCALYKMIGQTRDITYGKGERDLTYMMIHIWYKHFPVPAIYALRLLTQNVDDSGLFSSYGSWADIKHFCYYVFMNDSKNEALIDIAISIMNHQLDIDRRNWNQAMKTYLYEKTTNPMTLTDRPYGRDVMSLATKWVPRENSKFGWLYEKIVKQWFRTFNPNLLSENGNNIIREKSLNRCKRDYRKMISALNKELDTVQIKQCGGAWSKIMPENVSITTLMKQKHAFSNMNRALQFETDDRIECSKNFNEFYNGHSYESVKGKHSYIPLGSYVKQALQLLSMEKTDYVLSQIKWLNRSWMKQLASYHNCLDFIPFVDISWDSSPESAIGIGILIGQKSSFGRIMIYDHNPEWIHVSADDHFTDIIERIQKNVKHATDSNIKNAFNIIHESIVNTYMSESDMKKITVVILSGSTPKMEEIREFLQNTNDCIHLIYWNLCKTNYYECDSEEYDGCEGMNRMLRISGDSISSMNYFDKFGAEGVKNITAYEYIGEILNHPRYKFMGEYLYNLLS